MFLEKKPDASPTQGNTGNDADSEVSDVEERGYCDDSRSDPELRMRLKKVGKRKIEALYSNTDVVSILRHVKYSVYRCLIYNIMYYLLKYIFRYIR